MSLQRSMIRNDYQDNNRKKIKSNLSNRKCLDHDNKQIILVCQNQYCKSKRLVCKNCLKLHTAHPDDLIDDDQIEQKVQKSQQKCEKILKQLNDKFKSLTSQFRKLITLIETQFNISIEKMNEMNEEQFKQQFNWLIDEDQSQLKLTKIFTDGFTYFEDKIIQCQNNLDLKEFNKIITNEFTQNTKSNQFNQPNQPNFNQPNQPNQPNQLQNYQNNQNNHSNQSYQNNQNYQNNQKNQGNY